MLHNERIKNLLDNIIADLSANRDQYVKNPGVDFTRNRKLDFETVVKTILSMKGGSLNKELYECLGRTPELIATSSAFIQQRDKIKPELFESLFTRSNEVMSQYDTKTYKGYKLYAIDGSDILLWRNENSETFVKPQRTIKGEMTAGHNMYHLNAMYDLINKVYVSATLLPKSTCNERQEFINMIQDISSEQKTLLIADRGYPSWNVFAHIQHKQNADYLIRVQNNGTNLVKDLPMVELDIDKELIITIKHCNRNKDGYLHLQVRKNKMKNKKYSDGPISAQWDFTDDELLKIRIVRFPITDTTYETIFTSLPRDQFPLEEIKRLYTMRWGIETSFRELKYIIGLTNLHSKKDEFVRQEIFAKLTMYNFCERIIAAVEIEQNEDCKYTYQINYTMAMHICLDFFRCLVDGKNIDELIAKYILPIRPGRRDKRKMRNKIFIYFVYRVAA